MSARVVTSSLIWRWISVARAYRAAAVAGSVTSSGGLAQAVSWRARYALALHASVQYRGLRPPPGLGWSGRAVSQCRHRAGWPVSFRDVTELVTAARADGCGCSAFVERRSRFPCRGFRAALGTPMWGVLA